MPMGSLEKTIKKFDARVASGKEGSAMEITFAISF